jgi:hypothetical protein
MSLQIQVTADVAGAGKQIEDFSKKSRIALNSLSLVAQDLPFGFIGIQNNLPGVISSFGELTREAGGVGGALKQLGSALIGPAGLFFAFSVTTSIITSLVQKYGSLGAAITDIFGLQVKQRDLQNSINAEYADTLGKTAGEVVNLKSLESILTSTNSTLKERSGAYAELNKEYPGILEGINKEKALSGQLNEIIATRIKLFATQIELEGKADALKQLISKSAQEQLQLGAKIKTGGYFDVLGLQLKGLLQTGDAGVGGVLKSIQNTFSKTNAETKFFSETLNVVNKELVVINEEINKLIASTKKQKTEKFTPFSDIGDEGEAIDAAMSLDQINKLILANLRLAYGKNGSFTVVLNRLLEDRKRTINKKLQEEAAILAPKKVDKNAGPIYKNPLIEYQFGQITAIIDALKQEAKFIDDAFRAPLENLFVDFLQKGKLSFEDFTKSVMRNITQLVAKLAASKLFEALANLIPQIAGTLVPGGTGLMELTNILGRGRNIFGAANLGGIGGGGMNLNGQVVFVQRGTDLVGVMNRTNAQIQRIG